MIYKNISKEEYLEFHKLLKDKDLKFSKVAIGMWDFMKAWNKWPPRILEIDNDIVCICFMKISNLSKHKVLFISNIFTPFNHRKKGYASVMLNYNILEAVDLGATSIRLDCNREALKFYDSIDLTYWGTTKSSSMFCDLPINREGISYFKETKDKSALEILNMYPSDLKMAKIKWIKKKTKDHNEFDYGHKSMYSEIEHL